MRVKNISACKIPELKAVKAREGVHLLVVIPDSNFTPFQNRIIN